MPRLDPVTSMWTSLRIAEVYHAPRRVSQYLGDQLFRTDTDPRGVSSIWNGSYSDHKELVEITKHAKVRPECEGWTVS